jgi:hypothetical protein
VIVRRHRRRPPIQEPDHPFIVASHGWEIAGWLWTWTRKTAAIVKYNKNDGCSTCGYDSSDAVSSAVVRDGTIPIPEMLRRAAILFWPRSARTVHAIRRYRFSRSENNVRVVPVHQRSSTLWTGSAIRTEFDAAQVMMLSFACKPTYEGFVQETRPIFTTHRLRSPVSIVQVWKLLPYKASINLILP